MSRPVVIVAARRTPVAPRGGAFARLSIADLATPVLQAVLRDADVATEDVDGVILGNALYGGGNPARVVALAAGLPEQVPAMTIDTQCCAGIDAVSLAAAKIASGEADVIIAGGAESFSRSPLRMHRPLDPADAPEEYSRPPFTPWPDRDPDMLEAAAALAATRSVSRTEQEAFAVESHRLASADDLVRTEIVETAGVSVDAFTRPLMAKACARLPLLAGAPETGLTAATTAVEADAAAVLLVMSEEAAARSGLTKKSIRVTAGASVGDDPAMPAIAPVAAITTLLSRTGRSAADYDVIELMEAFAVQAMTNIADLCLDPAKVNARGGALARGHPIGASGAILLVRLYHDLMQGSAKSGLAAIAGAGGLGSAMALERLSSHA